MIYKKLNKIETVLVILISISIFCFYFIFNLNYLTIWIDEKYDSSTYKNHVENFLNTKEKDFYVKYNLFHPHHLLIDYYGVLFYQLLKSNGYSGNLMNALQLKNLLISSLALGIIFLLFYLISKKFFLSIFFVLSIGFSCGVWIYSQINDTPIIHSVILAILFLLTLYYPYAKRKTIFTFFIGVLHSINILFHQSDLIFCFVIIFIIIFSDYLKINNKKEKIDILKTVLNENRGYKILLRNIKNLFIYLITVLIIVGSTYYYVGIVYIGLTLDPSKAITVNKIKDASYFFNWLVLYSRIDYWGKGFEKNTITYALKGISDYFYQNDNLPISFKIDFTHFFNHENFLPNIIVCFFTFVLLSFILFFKKIILRYKYAILSNLIFIIIYTAFACWWEPDYREFWVAPMFSYWIFSFFVINFIIEKFQNIKPLPEIIINSFLFLLCFSLFYFNFIYFIYPNSSKNYKSFEIVRTEKNMLKK